STYRDWGFGIGDSKELLSRIPNPESRFTDSPGRGRVLHRREADNCKEAKKMATIHELPAESRKDEGKGASRRLRRADKVPAIVYGSSQEPASIQLDHNTVWLASQNEWFYSALLDLNLDGKTQKVLLRDLQRHPFKAQLLHLDFQR